MKLMLGALALAVALGALHAFSVILAPLERQVGADRASVSLVYALAIVSLTAGVLASDWLLRQLSPATTAITVAAVAACGLGLAASASTLWLLLIGFGVMFGVANGVGYSLFLRQATVAMPSGSGKAVGIVTAGYAVGAMLYSWTLTAYQDSMSASPALLWMAAGVAAAGGLGFVAFGRGRPVEPPSGHIDDPSSATAGTSLTGDLWLVYLLGATGGLMAIAHAAGIVVALGGSGALVALGASALAVGNVAGSLAGGRIADRFPPGICLAGATVLGGLASLALAGSDSPRLAVGGLLIAGVAYGALIALVPAVVARLASPAARMRVFGRVFTAWGAAGIAGPWIAGWVYDTTGDYPMALLLAAALSGLGAIIALWRLPGSTGA
jgi:OFA family oxalate/formate antiporter-like MFS transporter